MLQEALKFIEARSVPPEDMMRHMSHHEIDSAVVHFLRGITAIELYEKEDLYKTFIPGIDAYG